MAWDKREIIGLLRLEIESIRRRGLGPSFRDSVLCINAGKSHRADSCDQCLLLQFVPPEKQKQGVPCHYIPLNEKGDTLASLEGRPAREVEAVILAWMETALARLQRDLDEERARKAH